MQFACVTSCCVLAHFNALSPAHFPPALSLAQKAMQLESMLIVFNK